MTLQLDRIYEILQNTPGTLEALLSGLSRDWTHENEGPDTWSAFDVVGHLIHGENTDWIPRLEIILEHGVERPFSPFDRFAMFEVSRGKSLEELLAEFARLRAANLERLRSLDLTESDLDREGMHPELGRVSARQVLTTWAVHDLSHVAQIARVMAKQVKEDVGPWRVYLPIVDR